MVNRIREKLISAVLKSKNAAGEKSLAVLFFTMITASMAAILCVSSCGYHFPHRGLEIPKEIRRVAIPTFVNRTYEPQIEAVLTDAIREWFNKAGFAVVTNVEDADAVLFGAINSFKSLAISFSKSDYAMEYRISVEVHIKLKDRNNKVLWEDPKITRVEEYFSSPDIAISEQNRKMAFQKLAQNMMRDVTDRMFAGFDQ